MARTMSTPLPAGAWAADPLRTRLAFAAGPYRGRFDDFEIALVVAEGGEAGVSATVRGARFVSTAIRRDGDLIEVDGEVTIGARTLAVTAGGTVAEERAALVVALRTVVDRRQFGVGWSPPGTHGHEVAIDVRITFVGESP